ncbi:solute symporter family protein [Neisseria sp. Ec49-e6-T10]|uniref:solute symporter family protein n=1 Tax=Neisseria sp. Ec49-e6-T10 TaxID=3140744 RepID=UPI003EBF8EF9
MKQNNHTQHFFLANRQISSWQNAWALVGDYLSAAAFLGAIGLYFTSGFDSFYYAVATLIGWPLLLILFADKLRQSNAFTLSGVLTQRFNSTRLKTLSALTSICISTFYLLVQLVGAGKLLQLLFHLPYSISLSIVCLFTLCLVAIGGMKATTWIQIIKAICLFICAFILVILIWRHFNFSLGTLWQQAGQISQNQVFLPSSSLKNPIEQASLILGLILGLLGLPHVLMRFFTAKNPHAASLSAAYATLLITLFFGFNLIIGYGSYVIFHNTPLAGGSNMVLLHLSEYLGGSLFKWIISWMVLITILAVMSGLVLATSASLSKDILPRFIKINDQTEVRYTKISIIILLIISTFLAYQFESFNIAFLFSLAFAWAAGAHFPVLFLSFFYRHFTEKAAFYALLSGAICSFILIVLSQTVWVNILGFSTPLFPFVNPTLFTLPISLLLGLFLSKRTP